MPETMFSPPLTPLPGFYELNRQRYLLAYVDRGLLLFAASEFWMRRWLIRR